jgi:hypothetical protein
MKIAIIDKTSDRQKIEKPFGIVERSLFHYHGDLKR